jgi:beta-glucanase (GH16 family)
MRRLVQLVAVLAAAGYMIVASSATTSTAVASPSDDPMPAGDLPGWRQVFNDDFTESVPAGQFPAGVSSRWSAYADGWPDTSGKGTYYPSSISWHDGLMDIPIGWDGAHFIVNAPVPLLPTMLYGRYAVRFKADPVPGYKTAWLLWPDSGDWPSDGEIDLAEGNLDGTICSVLHPQGSTSGSDRDAYCTSADYSSWHTSVVEWTPSSVSFFLDGQLIGQSTNRIPNTPMHLVMQTEALSGPLPSTSANGHVYIDWVAAYEPATSLPPTEPMPVGDLPGWRQVFSDDFTQTLSAGQFPAAVASRWSAYADGWPDTSGKGTYYPSAISWHDGLMDVPIGWDGAHFIVNAPVPLLPTMLYGRYAVRFKADLVPGYRAAWLLWPDSEVWPSDGQIDLAEGDLDGTICSVLHPQGATFGSDRDAYCTSSGYSSWHTSVVEWTPTSVSFFLDDQLIGRSTNRIPNTPMHLVLQIETLSGGPLPSTSAKGHVYIDWVAAYQPATGLPPGEPMPVGDLPGWRQVFSDDFTQTLSAGQFPAAVSSRWSAYADGWPDTTGKGTYYPSDISWHDGLMDMPIGWDGAHFIVNAPVPLLPTMLYGRYAVRFKADLVPGYKTAWLLWPDSENWPADGEIDFPEDSLDGNVCAFVHHVGATSPSDQDAFCTGVPEAGAWHTAIIEWTPSSVSFTLDGLVIGSTSTRLPATPLHWVLQTETDGSALTSARGHIYLDWVTAYQPTAH